MERHVLCLTQPEVMANRSNQLGLKLGLPLTGPASSLAHHMGVRHTPSQNLVF